MPIHYSRLSPTDEYFAWSGQDGVLLHFAVTRMNAYLAGSGFPVSTIGLTEELVTDVLRQNGIEPDHLERITPERMEHPLLLLRWADETHVVADGGHRLVRRALSGIDHAQAWLVPERLWRRFVIDGMPGEATQWHTHLANENPLGRGVGQPKATGG